MEDALLAITVRVKPDGEICNSQILGFDGYIPSDPTIPDNENNTNDSDPVSEQNPEAVVWSAPRYYLRADHFSYHIRNRDGEMMSYTLADANQVFVDVGWKRLAYI